MFEIMWAASDNGLENQNQDSIGLYKRPVRVSAALVDFIFMCSMGHRGRDNYLCDKNHSVHAIMKSLTQWCQKWLDCLVSLKMFSTRCVH